MSRKKIVLIAVFCYLVLMAAGGAAYYAITLHEQQTAAESTESPEEIAAREAEKAKREAEEAERRAAEEAEAKEEQAAAANREARIAELEKSMTIKERNGMTLYTFGYSDTPAPGVYLRPFVVMLPSGKVLLKHDVYYYYTIEDPIGTNWIYGDHLDVTTDGLVETEAFDPEKLHKSMAVDAESLSENYVLTANKKILAMLKRIGEADVATIRYYKEGGKERVQTLGEGEKRRIRDCVELYELLTADD